MGASKHLSENLAMLRSLHNMSLVSFAAMVGVSKSTLQQIEQGHSPNLETLECIAQNLGIPASLLISDSLSPGQTILTQILPKLDWYHSWPQEDQTRFLELLEQLLHLLGKHTAPHAP